MRCCGALVRAFFPRARARQSTQKLKPKAAGPGPPTREATAATNRHGPGEPEYTALVGLTTKEAMGLEGGGAGGGVWKKKGPSTFWNADHQHIVPCFFLVFEQASILFGNSRNEK